MVLLSVTDSGFHQIQVSVVAVITCIHWPHSSIFQTKNQTIRPNY